MSRTTLTVTLSDQMMARVQAAAAEAGLSPEAWAAGILTAAFSQPGFGEDATTFDAAARDNDRLAEQTPEARAFQHTAALAALAEYDGTGERYPLEDVRGEVRADLETRPGMSEDTYDWTEAERRLEQYDRTGQFVDGDEALDAFVAEVEARAARRA